MASFNGTGLPFVVALRSIDLSHCSYTTITMTFQASVISTPQGVKMYLF